MTHEEAALRLLSPFEAGQVEITLERKIRDRILHGNFTPPLSQEWVDRKIREGLSPRFFVATGEGLDSIRVSMLERDDGMYQYDFFEVEMKESMKFAFNMKGRFLGGTRSFYDNGEETPALCDFVTDLALESINEVVVNE